MKHCFFYICLALTAFSNSIHQKPFILIIQGSCSTGKTSLCKTMVSQHNTWSHINTDQIFSDYILTMLNLKNPLALSIIKNAVDDCNIFHAIHYHEIYFKPNIQNEQKHNVLKAIKYARKKLSLYNFNHFQQTLFNTIDNEIANNKSILFDSWFIESIDHIKNKYPNHIVILLLITSSLQAVVDRMIQRNTQANLLQNVTNKRSYRTVLTSYFRYHALCVKQSDYTIAQYTIAELNSIFDAIKQEITQSAFVKSPKEMSHHEVCCLQSSVIPIDCLTQNIAYIVPQKITYDYIINTTFISPEQAVQQILEFLDTIQTT